MSFPTIPLNGVNLADKPKLHDHKSKEGKFATFTVYKNYSPLNPETGERVKKSEPFNIIAFGALADQCAIYLESGDRVNLVARVKHKYLEFDGKKILTYEHVLQSVEKTMLLGKSSIEYQIEKGEKPPVEILKDQHPRRDLDREM
jgi:single-stranded DNA-binding protein